MRSLQVVFVFEIIYRLTFWTAHGVCICTLQLFFFILSLIVKIFKGRERYKLRTLPTKKKEKKIQTETRPEDTCKSHNLSRQKTNIPRSQRTNRKYKSKRPTKGTKPQWKQTPLITSIEKHLTTQLRLQNYFNDAFFQIKISNFKTSANKEWKLILFS